jgi:hypothetical protein
MHGRQPIAEIRWQQFVARFFATLLIAAAVVYIFVYCINPYGNFPTLFQYDRHLVSISHRLMFPQIMRSGQFDSLLVGTSTSKLIDPDQLNEPFHARFANLSMYSATAWEQVTFIDYFRRKAQTPKVLIIGLDTVWCHQEAHRHRLTPAGFPFWLYDDNPWNDFLYVLNRETLEIAGRQIGYQLGLYPERVRRDGFEVFVPPEEEYDLAKASKKIWQERVPRTPPDIPPPVLSESRRRSLDFPALAWLDSTLAALPQTQKILVYMPVHVAAQPWPGTEAASVEAECKNRIARIAHARGAAVIDWRISSALTRDDTKYWDLVHYRLPVATLIATGTVDAVLRSQPSHDGLYVIVEQPPGETTGLRSHGAGASPGVVATNPAVPADHNNGSGPPDANVTTQPGAGRPPVTEEP